MSYIIENVFILKVFQVWTLPERALRQVHRPNGALELEPEKMVEAYLDRGPYHHVLKFQ